jgi:predicted dehydrogenase
VTGQAGRPVTVGFIGGGFMAEVHSRAARAARANLLGIVSSSPERSAAAAGVLGIDRAYPSIEAMLSDDRIDVVHVVTPNTSHLAHALAAIEAGKHVICEKPLTTSVADARQLVAAAESAGVTATVPFVYRFHPMVREARARIRAGEFGRLLSVQGSYLQDWLLAQTDGNWRVDAASGGPSRAFADIGSHLCDLLEFVTGDRVSRVQALKRTVFDSRPDVARVTTEDLVAVLFETRSGAVGTLLVSQVAPGRKNRLHFEIAGSGESIGFDQENPESLWIGRRQASEILPRGENMSADAARLSVLPAGHPLGYQDAFTAFVADSYAAIAGERHDGLPTFTDGLRAVRLTDAVLESAQTGAWVDIEGELA